MVEPDVFLNNKKLNKMKLCIKIMGNCFISNPKRHPNIPTQPINHFSMSIFSTCQEQIQSHQSYNAHWRDDPLLPSPNAFYISDSIFIISSEKFLSSTLMLPSIVRLDKWWYLNESYRSSSSSSSRRTYLREYEVRSSEAQYVVVWCRNKYVWSTQCYEWRWREVMNDVVGIDAGAYYNISAIIIQKPTIMILTTQTRARILQQWREMARTAVVVVWMQSAVIADKACVRQVERIGGDFTHRCR